MQPYVLEVEERLYWTSTTTGDISLIFLDVFLLKWTVPKLTVTFRAIFSKSLSDWEGHVHNA